MKKTLLAAALTAAAFACPLAAQTNSYPVDPYEKPYTGATRADVPREVTVVQPGMRVQIMSTSLPGYRRTGFLRSATAESVTVQTSGGEMVTVPDSALDGISVSLGRSAGRGALRGLWMGGAAGLILLPLAGNNGGDEEGESITSIARPENLAAGAVVGALIGAAWGREVWRRAARATPAELGRVRRERTASAPSVSIAPYAASPMSPETGKVAAGLSIRF